MGHLAIGIFISSLVLGMFAIYTSFIEKKRYRTALSKYIFYFLIVTNLAITINLFYNYFLVNLMGNLDFHLAKSFELLYRFLASILLIFVFGVFISLFRNLNGEIFSKKYKYTLLSIWVILMTIFSIKINSMFFYKTIPVPVLINVAIDYMGMLIVTFEVIRTIIKSGGNPNQVRRKIIKGFSYGFFVIILILLSMIPLSIYANIPNEILTFISSWILILFNLIPLLYLKKVLKKYYYDLIPEDIFPRGLPELLEAGRISETESRIIGLICDGLTNKEISDKLFLSLQTIKDHNYRIFKKLGVSNRVQLTKLFLNK
ncbi:MAG: helix-turn-helix transcriptional regulator [Acidobacteriota bacterium]